MKQIVRPFQVFLFFITLLFFSLINVSAQVTIGSGAKPATAALLDLKTEEAVIDINGVIDLVTSTTGGLLMPRVQLEKSKKLLPFIKPGTADYETEKLVHAGLMVYNLEEVESENLSEGINVWTGKEWVSFSKTLGTAEAKPMCDETVLSGVYTELETLGANNFIDIKLNVTEPGSYSLLAEPDIENGYYFTADGEFKYVGIYTVRLVGHGTPMKFTTTSGGDRVRVFMNGALIDCDPLFIDVEERIKPKYAIITAKKVGTSLKAQEYKVNKPLPPATHAATAYIDVEIAFHALAKGSDYNIVAIGYNGLGNLENKEEETPINSWEAYDWGVKFTGKGKIGEGEDVDLVNKIQKIRLYANPNALITTVNPLETRNFYIEAVNSTYRVGSYDYTEGMEDNMNSELIPPSDADIADFAVDVFSSATASYLYPAMKVNSVGALAYAPNFAWHNRFHASTKLWGANGLVPIEGVSFGVQTTTSNPSDTWWNGADILVVNWDTPATGQPASKVMDYVDNHAKGVILGYDVHTSPASLVALASQLTGLPFKIEIAPRTFWGKVKTGEQTHPILDGPFTEHYGWDDGNNGKTLDGGVWYETSGGFIGVPVASVEASKDWVVISVSAANADLAVMIAHRTKPIVIIGEGAYFYSDSQASSWIGASFATATDGTPIIVTCTANVDGVKDQKYATVQLYGNMIAWMSDLIHANPNYKWE